MVTQDLAASKDISCPTPPLYGTVFSLTVRKYLHTPLAKTFLNLDLVTRHAACHTSQISAS